MDDKIVCAVSRFLMVGIAVAYLGVSPVVAQSVAVETRSETVTVPTVHVDVVNAPLTTVLEAIAQQAGLRASWNATMINSATRVTLVVRDVPADVAFAKALFGTGMQAVIIAKRVDIRREANASIVSAAQGDILGKVVATKTRLPLRGATVALDGTKQTTTSGDDGGFRFSHVLPGTYTMRVRLLGYVRATQRVTVVDGQTVAVDVALEPSVNALDQVIVTGTVVATAQREVPNAMTVITAKELEQRGITRIDQLFRGDVPGLFSMNRGSENPLDQVTMFSRGAIALNEVLGQITTPNATILGTNQIFTAYSKPIKTYVDGVELADPSYLSQIDPRSIERIEILTGPQASTIYGSNALNGVMQVFTKRSVSPRPQLTASLLSGLVENDFRSSLTPQHDYSAQINGTEGHWAYNTGGSWNYVGAWTPAKQISVLSGFGGTRMDRGVVTADASLRMATTMNWQRANAQGAVIELIESGWYNAQSLGTERRQTQSLDGQTLGLTATLAPVSWWTHEVVLGRDVSTTETQIRNRKYESPSDTALSFVQRGSSRTSLRYATTVQGTIAPMTRAMVTLGMDGWQNLTTMLTTAPSSLTGTLSGTTTVVRQPGRNTGGFMQVQLGLHEQLFFTYGLRAEWNPDYGVEAEPNLAPRYGIALTHELGGVTAKLRGSYGRSTRPPEPRQKLGITVAEAFSSLGSFLPLIWGNGEYGNLNTLYYLLPNPELGPEYQRGGEGGVEVYFGQRASLVVTRYNQTVEDLIVSPYVDSIRSSQPTTASDVPLDAQGYGYKKLAQNLNGASIRNQGWELQGVLSLGPISTRGTYSWTKSRVIGIKPQYRASLLNSQYQPGTSFSYLPEHTWALGMTYAQAKTSVALNFTGTGTLRAQLSGTAAELTNVNIRLPNDRASYGLLVSQQLNLNPGYVMADLNATHRVNSRVEGVLQVQNVGDVYRQDRNAWYATMGRQSKAGVRIRW